MLTVESMDVEATLVGWVRDWLDLLAAGRLADACARLDEPNEYGRRWTPDAVMALVGEIYGPDTHFHVTHPEGPRFSPVAASAGDGRPNVIPCDDGTGFWVEHDVPLNGEFSDLTAQFQFLWRGDHALAARLHDLHVL